MGGQCTAPENSHVISLFFENISELNLNNLESFVFAVAFLKQILVFFQITCCWMHDLQILTSELVLNKANLGHYFERRETLVEFLDNVAIRVQSLAVQMSGVVSPPASDESMG